eukprot:1196201-Prorocentrum_minimum.AAC.8
MKPHSSSGDYVDFKGEGHETHECSRGDLRFVFKTSHAYENFEVRTNTKYTRWSRATGSRSEGIYPVALRDRLPLRRYIPGGLARLALPAPKVRLEKEIKKAYEASKPRKAFYKKFAKTITEPHVPFRSIVQSV